ncbi:hypothetical protein E1B28_000845 [Marasmius oreades]|uniref:Uncharacterized protein n=1 Tax=Marasmius oreades TaxID=181124 RepID=A0A9P7V299_9AGAR|nr:uncharacterized protein E1B28_000845 [Marasmius oreades]KAG7098956.1 hypothetical protein E1B28_000845 [Marasmius oreades]
MHTPSSYSKKMANSQTILGMMLLCALSKTATRRSPSLPSPPKNDMFSTPQARNSHFLISDALCGLFRQLVILNSQSPLLYYVVAVSNSHVIIVGNIDSGV